MSEFEFKGYKLLKDRKYAKTHEWAKIIEDSKVRVGITDFAQKKLKSVVFVEFNKNPGDTVQRGELVATVESIKSVGEVYAPLSGKVLSINTKLDDDPGLINRDPYGDGWIFELEAKDIKEYESLKDAEEYTKVIEEED